MIDFAFGHVEAIALWIELEMKIISAANGGSHLLMLRE